MFLPECRKHAQGHPDDDLLTEVIFAAALPLSGVRRYCRLKAFLCIMIQWPHWGQKHLHETFKLVTLPVWVCRPLPRSYSSIPSVTAAECPSLSPRAWHSRPRPPWPHLQNQEPLSEHQTLTLWTASWCMVTLTLTCQSQILYIETLTNKQCMFLHSYYHSQNLLAPEIALKAFCKIQTSLVKEMFQHC